MEPDLRKTGLRTPARIHATQDFGIGSSCIITYWWVHLCDSALLWLRPGVFRPLCLPLSGFLILSLEFVNCQLLSQPADSVLLLFVCTAWCFHIVRNAKVFGWAWMWQSPHLHLGHALCTHLHSQLGILSHLTAPLQDCYLLPVTFACSTSWALSIHSFSSHCKPVLPRANPPKGESGPSCPFLAKFCPLVHMVDCWLVQNRALRSGAFFASSAVAEMPPVCLDQNTAVRPMPQKGLLAASHL